MEIPVELIELGGEPRLCIRRERVRSLYGVLSLDIYARENVFVREAEPEPGHGSLDLSCITLLQRCYRFDQPFI